MKKLIQLFLFSALVAALALQAIARTRSSSAEVSGTTGVAVPAQQGDEQVKADLYKKFRDNYKTNQQVAYDTAKEYLQKFPNDDDEIAKYLKNFVNKYEKGSRKANLTKAIYTDKNYAEAFSTGKQIFADEPEYLKGYIDLGYAGYLAATAKNEAYNTEAIGYARKAIQMLEAGKTPDEWRPFTGKEDTLAYLYYTIGVLNFKNNPAEAIPAFIRAASFNSDIKKSPSTYYLLAASYEAGPYKTMSADFTSRFQGKPETDESKLALANLNQTIDRIIDAYARAVATAGNDPKNAQNKTDWMKRLTELYKFRHDNSEAGLKELVAGIASQPLPPPPTPITTLPASTTGTGTGDGAGATTSGTTTTTPSGTAPATPAQPANRTTTAPASTAKPAPAASGSTTKPRPKTAHARRP